ncbi:hypothetical protein FACS1894113_5460 [Alphaproteobacteria bacterium]|nr:hypothetical protein FACS1894113_5460 [Alphaproteobacteria bacterium]
MLAGICSPEASDDFERFLDNPDRNYERLKDCLNRISDDEIDMNCADNHILYEQ